MKRFAKLSSQRPRHGFTLIEMLVVLTLLAMISALLWQALQQVLRVERVLERSGVDGQVEVVHREWLRGILQASLVEQNGAPRQLQGDTQQLTVISAEALNLPGLKAEKLQIRLESDAGSGQQRLMVAEAPAADAFAQGSRTPAAPVAVLAWQGRPGSIRFLDIDGRWLEQWPPPPAAPLPDKSSDEAYMRAARAAMPRLPRAIWLDLGAEVGGPLVTALSVTEPGRQRLSQWEQQ